MKTTTLIVTMLIAGTAFAGDTYDCINSKGDYVNYGPAIVREYNTTSIIACDSAQSEPRYRAMLDEKDMRALIFLQARQTNTVLGNQGGVILGLRR